MSAVAGKPGQKYSISASAGRYGWAETLAGAKKVGMKIAKLEAYKGKWNMSYISVTIYVGGGSYYKTTGWHMYVPVAGSGRRLASTIDEIKRRHGVAPFKWTKK